MLFLLHKVYYDFTSKLQIKLQSNYILSCNYSVIQSNYMKKSVPPIFANGGVRLFHVKPKHLLYFYTLAVKFYIQDVMFYVNFLIYLVIPSVLHRQCLPLHPGCNGHVRENEKKDFTWNYMNFTYVYMECNLLRAFFIFFIYIHGLNIFTLILHQLYW